MAKYYFDMETTGLAPEHDKIITLQTQRLVGRYHIELNSTLRSKLQLKDSLLPAAL